MKSEEAMERSLREALRARAATGDCPAEEAWLGLLRGDLGSGEAEALRGHLEACAACAEAARDARRFLVAMGESSTPARDERPPAGWPWMPALAAAAAVLLVAGAVLWRTGVGRRAETDPVARLAAALELPAGADSLRGSNDSELFRGSGERSERSTSLAAALAPATGRRFAEACAALSAHARRFPDDREARYLGAVACLKAGEADRADTALASLAASAGEWREEARQLLERLRRARGAP